MSKQSRKILVTGVAGFLGSHLAEELSKNKLWNIREFFKSNYIINKDVNAWYCLSEITK